MLEIETPKTEIENGIEFDELTRDWAVWVRGDLQGYRATCAEALELLDECEARYARYEREQAMKVAAYQSSLREMKIAA